MVQDPQIWVLGVHLGNFRKDLGDHLWFLQRGVPLHVLVHLLDLKTIIWGPWEYTEKYSIFFFPDLFF
jgi:hypothetical protein